MRHEMGACKMMWHHLRQSRNWFWLQIFGYLFSLYGYTRDPYYDPLFKCSENLILYLFHRSTSL
ncbi:hypothetical protein Hanom_Chr14g01310721 [Helianthus anomalus]